MEKASYHGELVKFHILRPVRPLVPPVVSSQRTVDRMRPAQLADRFSARIRASGLCLLWMVGFALIPISAHAQKSQLGGVEPAGQYPNQLHYNGLQVYRDGDLENAIDVFEAALRNSRRDINGRWIDAIPTLAMLAECHWQLGDLVAAREHVDHVFQIAIRNRGWLGRIDWGSTMQPVSRAQPAWLWAEARAVGVLPVADKIMYRSGQPLTPQALVHGGEIEEQNLRTMDIIELMRGLAIASYRRRVLLGPLSDQDPLANGLLEATRYPAGLEIPIARALIGSVRTTGYFASFDDKRAVSEGAQSGIFNGGVHPLSAINMLSQASVIAGTDKPEGVVPLAMNIIHSAAALRQPEFIGEAMQLAAGCASEAQAAAVRQAASTVATAMFRESRLATVHCLIAGADAAITAGDLASAATMLGQAQSLTGRRDMLQPRLEGYGAYVAARLAAARGASIGIGDSTDLDHAIERIQSFALHHRTRKKQLVSMPRVYQLGLIRQAIGTSLGGATSDKMLKEYCDDPPADVWRRDAVDGLAAAMLDRSIAHAARINLAASQGYAEPLLKAADTMLAARFRQQLPLGGRIAQVRAIARADENLVDKSVIEFRDKAGRGMKEVRTAALAMAEPDPLQAQMIEAKACAVALSRLHLPHAMPPLLDEKLPIAELPKRTGLLTFVAVGNKLYGTLASDGKVMMWSVAGSSRLPGEIGRLLKAVGVGKPRGNRLPENESWKELAVTLRRHLLPEEAKISEEVFDELIIVPDGALWYLPFEMLPLGDANSPLIADTISVRYAATPGLALKSVAPPPISRAIGLVADLFFAPRDPEANEAIVQSIVDVLNDPVRMPKVVDTPTGLLGNKIGHLVVAAPRIPHPQNQLLMSVAPYDQTNPFGTLAAWMRFPADVPRTVLLVGFRTPLDTGKIGNGDEIFTTLCALNAAGVRSILLSRWAVGGESSALALRELLQELPFTGINASWNRARMILRRSELDPAAEPLLTKAEYDREGVTGNEPLFWAGYMVSSPHLPGQQDAR